LFTLSVDTDTGSGFLASRFQTRYAIDDRTQGAAVDRQMFLLFCALGCWAIAGMSTPVANWARHRPNQLERGTQHLAIAGYAATLGFGTTGLACIVLAIAD
jgi:hypothetical protein